MSLYFETVVLNRARDPAPLSLRLYAGFLQD